MDTVKGKGKKGLITKTWERCKSFGQVGGHVRHEHKNHPSRILVAKSKSWPRGLEEEEDVKRGRKQKVTPEGCFSVYVGPEKQKFVIKTKYINHPLFKVLLEEAELEYGYKCEGPLVLPCNVDIFMRALAEMDEYANEIPQGCSFARSYNGSSYHHLSPSRIIVGMNNL